MEVEEKNAAEALVGRTLKNGWYVSEKIGKDEDASGGFFSVCYSVVKENKIAFMKALNFFAFFQLFPGKTIVEVINEQTNAFQFEKELLLRCKEKRLSKVSIILDEGEEYVEGFTIPNVPYLIFEMADGDIRSHIKFSEELDLTWKLKSLHDVAVGIKQLHGVKIGHQDLKPSNVLIFDEGFASKIGDLGRSLCEDIKAPHDNGGFVGDFNYAPPEFLYGYIEPDFNTRIKATDLYLFGSLIVFYFTGATMNSLLAKNISKEFRWNEWRGTFYEVSDYLINGFYSALKEFRNSIEDNTISDSLEYIVEYCCYPIPEKRGHPKSINTAWDKEGNRKPTFNQYSLERIITKFDYLKTKSMFKFK